MPYRANNGYFGPRQDKRKKRGYVRPPLPRALIRYLYEDMNIDLGYNEVKRDIKAAYRFLEEKGYNVGSMHGDNVHTDLLKIAFVKWLDTIED